MDGMGPVDSNIIIDSLHKKVLDYNQYMDHFYLALYKDNRIYKKWVKHIIFLIVILLIIYYIYTIR